MNDQIQCAHVAKQFMVKMNIIKHNQFYNKSSFFFFEQMCMGFINNKGTKITQIKIP